MEMKLRDKKIKEFVIQLFQSLLTSFKIKQHQTKSLFSEMRQFSFKPFSLYFLISASLFLSSCFLFQDPPLEGNDEGVSSVCAVGNARFIANQISSPPNHNPITINYKNALADSFTLNLKTCLRDASLKDYSIQNASFEILYHSNFTNKEERVSAISDTNGCIQWQEIYKYKYTLNSTWVGLKRVIKQVQGPYSRGGVEIETAVNPWMSDAEKNSGLPQMIDMRCEYVNRTIFESAKKHNQNIQYYKEGLEFLKSADQRKPLLMAPDFTLEVEEIPYKRVDQKADIKETIRNLQKPCGSYDDKNCYKRRFKFDYRIPLEFISLSSIDSFKTELKGGVYNVASILTIQPKGEKETYELSTCEKKEITLNANDDKLAFSCEFDITAFYQNSLFHVYLQINPVNSDDPDKENYLPLRDFEGKYRIQFDFINTGPRNITLVTDDDNIYEKTLKAPKAKLNLIQGESFKSAIELLTKRENKSSITSEALQLGLTGDFDFSNIQAGENTIERTVSFVGKICLKDSLNSHQLTSTKFKIFLEGTRGNQFKMETQENKRSSIVLYEGEPNMESGFEEISEEEGLENNAENCITIPILVEHKIFNRQKYFEVIAHVYSEKLNLYGKVSLAFNPWQRAFQAFQDAQNLDERHIRYDVEDIPKPELVINQFRSINLFPSYGLDKLLNIHILHRFYLLFQPFIRRPDNVSLGLDHRSRELLRDGYYLVRVLILRNPKETGHWEAVYNVENLNQERTMIYLEEDEDNLDLTKSDYITHTDLVVRTKANFVNFYMPLHISTKQMYYIASRNIVAIQIYPADPAYIKYKEGSEIIDTEKTKWKAFTDHELQNKAYGGALNIQNWTNWNLLQPVKIDTDKVIALSPIGKKYKHFNFSNLDEEQRPQNIFEEEGCEQDLEPFLISSPELKSLFEEKTIMREEFNRMQKNIVTLRETGQLVGSEQKKKMEILQQWKDTENKIKLFFEPKEQKEMTEEQKKEEQKKSKVRECVNKNSLNKLKSLDPALEVYVEGIESADITDIKSKFSLENSLKPIELGTETAGELIESLKGSFGKYLDKKRNNEKNFSLNSKPHFLWSAHYYLFFRAFNYMQKRFYQKYPDRFNYQDDLKLRKIKSRDLSDSYMLMLNEYSRSEDFLSVILNFIEKNQEVLGYNRDLLGERNCKILEDYSCQREKLDLLIDSNIFENLSFTHDMDSELFVKKQTLIFMMLFLLPQESLDLLIEHFNPYLDLLKKPNVSNYSEIYLEKIEEILKENRDNIIQKYNYFNNPLSVQDRAKIKLNSLSQRDLEDLALRFVSDEEYINPSALKSLVNRGLKKENYKDYKNLPFLKSLCSFWFEDFMKNYLDPKLRISTYTNYMRQFDYLQALEHAYVSSDLDYGAFNKDIQFVLDQTENKFMGEEEKTCHGEYRTCVAEDFCSGGYLNKNKPEDSGHQYCRKLGSDNFNFCSSWVAENVCSKTEHSDLKLCDPERESEITCEDVNNTCRLNPDKSFCSDFENRCFKKYATCLGELETDSELFQRSLDYILKDTQSAVENCTRDFNEFFKVENKMIIHEISHDDNDFTYNGGFLKSFSYTHNNSVGSYMNWTAQRGRSVSVKANANVGASLGEFIAKVFNLAFGISADISQSQSSNESNSGRVAWDARAGDALFLSVGRAQVKVGVKKFQKCLVIKPRPNTFRARFENGKPEYYKNLWSDKVTDFDKIIFSRPGLMLCNPVEQRKNDNLEEITESYYYISQANLDPSNSQFLDLYDLANRPFVAIIRGNREFLKFYHVARMIKIDEERKPDKGYEFQNEDFYYGRYLKRTTVTQAPQNMFTDYDDIVDHALFLSLELRTQTGFYPGVYDYPFDTAQELSANYLEGDETYAQEILHPVDVFEVPNFKGDEVVPLNDRW